MGLNFGTLLNAALMGTAAYQGGKRAGQKDKREEDRLAAAAARQAELDRQAAQLHEAQIGNYKSLEADRIYDNEHPKKSDTQIYREEYDALRASGMSRDEASAEMRARYGKTEERPSGPVYGSPDYLKAVDAVESVRDRHQGGRASGSGTTDDGSDVAADRKRAAYIAKNLPARMKGKYENQGYTGAMDRDEAIASLNEEWARMNGPFADAVGGHSSGTAAMLAKTIPTGGSANAGTRGVKPAMSTSTPKQDPTKATSPKIGTPTTGEKDPLGDPKTVISAAQAAALKSAGKTDQEIRDYFIVR